MVRKMNDFEKKIKEIVGIDDTWEIVSSYGKTQYFTFLGNKFCVSKCVHYRAVPNTYVVSDENKRFYYSGFEESKAINTIKKLIKKNREMNKDETK